MTWGQYTLMDLHGVTNAGSLWVLYLQSHRLQGVQLDYFHIQTTLICVIGQMIGGGGMMDRAYLGLFFLVVERFATVSGYICCQICTYPIKNDNKISLFPVLCYFIK